MKQLNRQKNSLLFIHLLMVVAATLVSTSFIVGASITHSFDPTVLTMIRFFCAAVFFGPIVHVLYGLQPSISLIYRCAAVSGCLVIFFICMFWALRYTTPLNTSVIFSLVPSISGFYAFFINRERFKRVQLIALLCGMIGTWWVIFRGDSSSIFSANLNMGDVIFFVGCLFMGLYTPLVRLLHRGEPMAVMTFWVLVTGTVYLFIFFGYKLIDLKYSQIPLLAWGGVVYLAVFTTVITFFLTQYSVLYLGPTRVMAYSYLYPGLVVVLEIVLGKEMPPLIILPGVFIILTAMFFLQRTQQEKSL